MYFLDGFNVGLCCIGMVFLVVLFNIVYYIIYVDSIIIYYLLSYNRVFYCCLYMWFEMIFFLKLFWFYVNVDYDVEGFSVVGSGFYLFM